MIGKLGADNPGRSKNKLVLRQFAKIKIRMDSIRFCLELLTGYLHLVYLSLFLSG